MTPIFFYEALLNPSLTSRVRFKALTNETPPYPPQFYERVHGISLLMVQARVFVIC